MARATALTMECVTRMNSISNGPSGMRCPGFDGVETWLRSSISCSSSRRSTKRKGELGSVDGNLSCDSRNGTPPMWSSCPWVRIRPRTMLACCFKIGEIGSDDIDAEQFRFGEHHARIDDDDVISIAKRHGVHAELAQSADAELLAASDQA